VVGASAVIRFAADSQSTQSSGCIDIRVMKRSSLFAPVPYRDTDLSLTIVPDSASRGPAAEYGLACSAPSRTAVSIGVMAVPMQLLALQFPTWQEILVALALAGLGALVSWAFNRFADRLVAQYGQVLPRRSFPRLLLRPIISIDQAGFFGLLMLVLAIFYVLRDQTDFAIAFASIALTTLATVLSRTGSTLRQRQDGTAEERRLRRKAEADLEEAQRELRDVRADLAAKEATRSRLDQIAILHNQVTHLTIGLIESYRTDPAYAGAQLDRDIEHLIEMFAKHVCLTFQPPEGAGMGVAVHRLGADGGTLRMWGDRDVRNRHLDEIVFYVGPDAQRRKREAGLAGETFRSGKTQVARITRTVRPDGQVRFSSDNRNFWFPGGPGVDPQFASIITACIPDCRRNPRAVLCIDSTWQTMFEPVETQRLAEALARTVAIPIMLHDWMKS
jgi:hypothetical protein